MEERASLESRQLESLRDIIARCAATDGHFYASVIASAGWGETGPSSLQEFREDIPFTTKAMLVADRESKPPYGTILTAPVSACTRFHRTSGTTGNPVIWLDTPSSWSALLDAWETNLRHAGVRAGDTVFCAFSFGPFIGFWLAFEAAARMGCLTIPAGGLSSAARISLLELSGAGVLCCTPTYAIRLGEAAREAGARTNVAKLIVAGEPGGSIPETRRALSALWNGAAVFDHHGLTETGPVSFEDISLPACLCVMEEHFFAEVVSPESGLEVAEGETGELVLTTLRRDACPLLRYRTGDIVRKRFAEVDGRKTLVLEGGILGRADDMVVVRGVNIYPSAIEGIIRRFEEVGEYQVRLTTERAMNEIEILVEWEGPDAQAGSRDVEEALRDAFSLRIPVRAVGTGELPRFEFKSKRWVRGAQESP